MSRGPALLDREDEACEDAWQDSSLLHRQPSRVDSPVSLSDDWMIQDPLEELVDQLFRMGRTEQARTVETLLGLDRREDDDVRSYVSALWAEDWNSPEDSAYDSL